MLEAVSSPADGVECLGLRFPGEEARRAHFVRLLAERLCDLRDVPGFPRGDACDILAASDPPYYTACPNPFLADLLGPRASSPAPVRTPFATDVRAGKNDPIYNAHSYHTKLPHQAIQRYVEHYTSPGDVVLDCFCGTGMTGVACAGLPEPRRVVLCDLSPAATSIAYGYMASKDLAAARQTMERAATAIRAELGWMYETLHTGWPSGDRRLRRSPAENPGRSGKKGFVRFVLWSDVFRCPSCGAEVVYWHEAASAESARLSSEVGCPACPARSAKRHLERLFAEAFDADIGMTVRQALRVPVLIEYEAEGRVFHKVPDDDDLRLIDRTNGLAIRSPYPTHELPRGDKTSDPRSVGITHVHHFYTRRNLAVLAELRRRAAEAPLADRAVLQFLFTSTHPWTTRMNRLLVSNFFRKRGGVIGQTLSGTLYVSSLSIETNPTHRLRLRARSASHTASTRGCFVTTQSAASLRQIPDDSIGYAFVDPPFGHNLVYSDLSFLWESWLGVHTAREQEAVVSPAQRKPLAEYERLIRLAFCEIRRVLEPGRWVTVVFHNTRSAVWRAIQRALADAGLLVAAVSILDKTHGTYNQVTAEGAVGKDLAISAYKPTMAAERRFRLEPGSPEAAWAFVREHLERLPLPGPEAGSAVVERQRQHIYDRMIAFHVRYGIEVPLSAAEVFAGLQERFVVRDEMVFLPEQFGDPLG